MKAKKNMYAKGGKSDPKKKKKKKKTPKGYDVSVGGNIDYNKPNKKTGFAGSSDDRETAKKMLSSQLKDAGVLGAERTKAYQKKKLTQRGDKFTASTEVSSPMDVKKYGGKVKAVKKYKNGGKTGDPKKKKREVVRDKYKRSSSPSLPIMKKKTVYKKDGSVEQKTVLKGKKGRREVTRAEGKPDEKGIVFLKQKGETKIREGRDERKFKRKAARFFKKQNK